MSVSVLWMAALPAVRRRIQFGRAKDSAGLQSEVWLSQTITKGRLGPLIISASGTSINL